MIHKATPLASERRGDTLQGNPSKRNSNSCGARPVHLIITMLQWIRTSGLSIKESLSLTPQPSQRYTAAEVAQFMARVDEPHPGQVLTHHLCDTTVHSENFTTESCTERYSSHFKDTCLAEMCSDSEEGSYLRLTDCCITQL